MDFEVYHGCSNEKLSDPDHFKGIKNVQDVQSGQDFKIVTIHANNEFNTMIVDLCNMDICNMNVAFRNVYMIYIEQCVFMVNY